MHDKISKILDQKMSRKQFLKASGTGVLAILGVTALLDLIDGHKTSNNHHADAGYGLGSYGGVSYDRNLVKHSKQIKVTG
jgi:hypothetical protein